MGLEQGTAVGAGVIDVYAGWIGTVGAKIDIDETAYNPNLGPVLNASDKRKQIFSRLAIVARTSSYHLAMSPGPVYVPGVWGPYRDTIFPDC